ncbi:hypothetical protein BT96DRAFT_925316 [Gymnopus androsaceus JB14]|uniref:Uncharacterized protein n=1 Tax=Gymnopus androsaceus JB14 TaxID=1447944 RepID=A0A6A4H149_9AGAR|nr:hypothetical protein BT96DRAFT_925316 [Gymnopus androsaceus JB14]
MAAPTFATSSASLHYDNTLKPLYYPVRADEEGFEEHPMMDYNHPYPHSDPPSASGSTSLFRFSRRTRAGYVIICAGFLGAAVLAIVNHIVFSRTKWDGDGGSYASICVSFTLLAALNCLSFASAHAVALTSVFVPGSLTITSSPARTKLISVPTIDLNLVAPSASAGNAGSNTDLSEITFSTPSQRWQQLISRAATTNIAPTWDPPAECGVTCNYKFSYSAPALDCTPLSQQDIWPNNVTNSNSSNGLAFPLLDGDGFASQYFFYNASYTVDVQNTVVSFGNSALEVFYVEGFNSTTLANSLVNGTQADISQLSAHGAICTFQNATYEATTSFSNNTQTSSTSVVELGGTLPFEPADGNFNSTMAGLSISYIYGELFSGNAFHNATSGTDTTSTQALLTPLFNLTSVVLQSNVTDGYFSLSQSLNGNLSQGLQDLLGNVTLSLVNEKFATTQVNATVTSATTEYLYHWSRLAITYGVVFSCAAVMVFLGISCLHANDITATFDLEQILEMTATSSGLHELAVRSDFEDVPVKGKLVFGGNGLTAPVLDIDRERKNV